MKVLVLGGTGFIGRRLVNDLISSGKDVTLATSGKSPNPFGDRVSILVADRFSRESMNNAFSGDSYFDVVFDTVGYRSLDLRNSLEALNRKCGKYVYISSAAVYRGKKGILSEKDFDAGKQDYAGPGLEKSYEQGKRSSEAYLLNNASIPVAIARFPNVMGYDDSTLRFQDHVARLVDEKEFKFPEREGRRNSVWVEDAGRFLAWLGSSNITGVYNGASADSMKASEFISKMAFFLGTSARIVAQPELSNSRYYTKEDFILDVSKAEESGFRFTPTTEWLEKETKSAAEHGNSSPNSEDYANQLFP